MKYLHSAIRFVPDAARGESVNVGVIVTPSDGGPGQFLSLIHIPSPRD